MLLDTHTLLWFLNEDPNLPRKTRQIIEEADVLFVSVVSLWEIAIKINIGKLTLTIPFESMEEAIASSSIDLLQISFKDTSCYSTLPLHHRDPFDRILIAQCMVRNYPLISCDAVLDAYDIQRLWD